MAKLTLNLSPKKQLELKQLALQYGLSLEEFSRQILEQVSSEIGTDNWGEYTASTKTSFARGLKDWQRGKIVKTL